jgi:hypothetical protein
MSVARGADCSDGAQHDRLETLYLVTALCTECWDQPSLPDQLRERASDTRWCARLRTWGYAGASADDLAALRVKEKVGAG